MAPRLLLIVALAACAAPALAHSLHAPSAPHYVYSDVENACDEPVEVTIAGVAKSLAPGALARFELCTGTCPGHEDACGHYSYTYTARSASPAGQTWSGTETVPACALDSNVVSAVTLTCGGRRALLQNDDEDYGEDYGDDDTSYGDDDTSYGDDDATYGDDPDSPSDSGYSVHVDVVNNCIEQVEAEIGGPDDVMSSIIDPGNTERFTICFGYCTGYEGRCESIEYDYTAWVTADYVEYTMDGVFVVDSCALTADYVTTITLTCDDLETGPYGSADTGESPPADSSPSPYLSPSASLGTGTPGINPYAGSPPAVTGTPATPGTSPAPISSGGATNITVGAGGVAGVDSARNATTGGTSSSSGSMSIAKAWHTMVLVACMLLALI